MKHQKLLKMFHLEEKIVHYLEVYEEYINKKNRVFGVK